MRYNDRKSQFFKAVYKICRKQSIDFMDFDSKHSTIEQQKIQAVFYKRNRSEDFTLFIKFYQSQVRKEQPLIIVSTSQNMDSWNRTDILIKKQKIYGGFMYLDRKDFLLLDRSYKSIINRIGKEYLELEEALENKKERNSIYDRN